MVIEQGRDDSESLDPGIAGYIYQVIANGKQCATQMSSGDGELRRY